MPLGCACFSRRAESPSNRVMVPALNRLVSFHTGDDRIKYNIDDAEIEKFCVESGSKETLPVKGNTLLEQSSLSQKDEQNCLPAYVDGEEIEYYSSSYQRWLHGVVQCTESPGKGYTIALSQGGQIRENIGLDLLRSPLQPHERVEIFTGRQGGTRIAAVIAESQPAHSSLLGNQVKVEGSNEVFDSVPSLRLKRRYIRNQEIEVYRGVQRGWQSAKVHHSASPDGCGAEVLYPEGTEEAFDVSSSQDMEKVTSEGHTFSPSVMGLWSLVPVYRDAGLENAPTESIPSYLIRAVQRTT